ncbi:SixA phosphatase family protein [Tunicatimonas pelagia]|uniref:SixA phosphatase family protein n=1 Tax=Tunicatimonas pelagia TaxID=931531 RepID=UPI0026651E17|nr:histidine phosphatase family protein [Tunicatimonas pelagia]WKN42919.1 histidine phosphatase family protein [Tunicatimonas pelagia]
MTKTLYLVRHAKSSWKDTSVVDYDRSLNKRGKRDAPEMGKRLAAKNIHPDWVISSPAKRAKLTIEAIATEINYAESQIRWAEKLYHADVETLLGQIRSLENQYQSLMLVGHNPGLTDLQNSLCNEAIENIVTTGIVCIQFDVADWANVRSGQLQWYDYPKKEEQ